MSTINGSFRNNGTRINFKITGTLYNGDDANGATPGGWDSSNIFGIQINSNKVSLIQFNDDGTVIQTYYSVTIPQNTLDRLLNPSTASSTFTELVKSINPISKGTGTWSGTLPLNYILDTGTQIDLNMQEFYKAQGTDSLSFDQNYQATMMSGILVAMLGTTILYYTFMNV